MEPEGGKVTGPGCALRRRDSRGFVLRGLHSRRREWPGIGRVQALSRFIVNGDIHDIDEGPIIHKTFSVSCEGPIIIGNIGTREQPL